MPYEQFYTRVALNAIIMSKGAKGDVITASEISQYIYCPVAWYLKRSGCSPQSPGLERGIDKHIEVGKKLSLVQKQERSVQMLRRLEYLMIFTAFVLMGWWLLQFYL